VVIGPKEVEMQKEKVEGVLKWPVPRNVKDVRATRAQDSRRILSNITVYNCDTTHLQENPQRLG